jgi:hypothetical protein
MQQTIGHKRRRDAEGDTNTGICAHCEECSYRHTQLMSYIQYLNDLIQEMNKLIIQANERYNERGGTLSYIS